jgi:hypothetical protein
MQEARRSQQVTELKRYTLSGHRHQHTMGGGAFGEGERLEEPPPVRDRRVCSTVSGGQLTSGKDPEPGCPERP